MNDAEEREAQVRAAEFLAGQRRIRVKTPPMVALNHAIEDLDLLVSLLDLDVGPVVRRPEGHVRIYRSPGGLVNVGIDALYRLRRLYLVELGEAHFYFGGQPVRTPKQPLPILTPAGRRLALAELNG